MFALIITSPQLLVLHLLLLDMLVLVFYFVISAQKNIFITKILYIYLTSSFSQFTTLSQLCPYVTLDIVFLSADPPLGGSLVGNVLLLVSGLPYREKWMRKYKNLISVQLKIITYNYFILKMYQICDMSFYENFNKNILLNFLAKVVIQKLMCKIWYIFKMKWFIYFPLKGGAQKSAGWC